MRKSFSLLEIIFTITIIGIVASFAIPKLFYNIDTANIIKLKADIALIRNGINNFNNQQILTNTNLSLNTLDDNSNLLFTKVLKVPLVSEINKSGNWSKNSATSYNAWISSTQFIEFIYNINDSSFNCNFEEDYCKELSQ